MTASRRLYRILAVGVLCGMLEPGVAGAAATRVVFTADVESTEAFTLPSQIDARCRDGSACGLTEIVRLLRERQWAGTFFLDVFERQQWGDDVMRRIAIGLQGAGQDVALHTHPDAMYDRRRPAMHQYSLEEQTAIVRDGVRLLQGWTGRPVVAHRAGSYAADENTLIALDRNGIVLDSSAFWRHPASRLDRVGLGRNLPSLYRRLVEIPVTVYEREDRPLLVAGLFAPVSAARKIDPNWLVNEQEARTAIDAAVEARFPVIVIFFHSFSLMQEGSHGEARADRHARDMYMAILDQVARRNLQVVTMRELAGEAMLPSSTFVDDVPRVAVQVDWLRYIARRARAAGLKGSSLPVAAAVLTAALIALLVARRRRAAGRRFEGVEPSERVRTPTGVQLQ